MAVDQAGRYRYTMCVDMDCCLINIQVLRFSNVGDFSINRDNTIPISKRRLNLARTGFDQYL